MTHPMPQSHPHQSIRWGLASTLGALLLLAVPGVVTDCQARDQGLRRESAAALANAAHTVIRVDVNTASAPELEQVKGIGPRTAARIVQARERGGRFRDAEDLRKRVSGIGPIKLKKMSDSGLILPGTIEPLIPGSSSGRIELIVGQAPGKRDQHRGVINTLPPPGSPR